MSKSSALEAFELAVIIITLGIASNAWYEILGAVGLTFIASVVVVLALHTYLLKVPDVLIKLGTGILLLSLGTFWLGEGLGWDWYGDWSILGLLGLYSLIAALSLFWIRRDVSDDMGLAD